MRARPTQAVGKEPLLGPEEAFSESESKRETITRPVMKQRQPGSRMALSKASAAGPSTDDADLPPHCEVIIRPFLNCEKINSEINFKEQGHSAYLRSAEGLVYYDIKTRNYTLITAEQQELDVFDAVFPALDGNDQPCFLTKRDLQKIYFITADNKFWSTLDPLPPQSQWQEKNGVDLLWVNFSPQRLDLNTLPFTNAAYLRYRGQLWYVKKNRPWFGTGFTPEYRFISKDQEALARFDAAMQAEHIHADEINQVTESEIGEIDELELTPEVTPAASKYHKHLKEEDIRTIGALFGHVHRTPWQKFLNAFGYFCTSIFAVSCGVQTAGTFIALNLVTGGLATAGAILLFVAGTAVNWWIFKRYTSPVLIDLFGREKFFVDKNGKSLRTWIKIAIGISLMLSLSVGITFGALAYSSTFTLSVAIPFLIVIAPAFPYIATSLLVFTFFCMTALMFKDIFNLFQEEDVIGEVKKFLKNLVSIDPDLPLNKGKSLRQIIAERVITVTLTVIFLALAALGLFMTMNACAPGVKAILLEKIPRLSAATAQLISRVITLGFACLGEMPFGVKNVFRVIARAVPAAFQLAIAASRAIANGLTRCFGSSRSDSELSHLQEEEALLAPGTTIPIESETNTKAPETRRKKIWEGVKLGFQLVCVGINALGNGLISVFGALGGTITLASPVFRWLALISGTENSALAGIPAVMDDSRPDWPPGPGRTPSSSTLVMLRTCGQQGQPLTTTADIDEDDHTPRSSTTGAYYPPKPHSALEAKAHGFNGPRDSALEGSLSFSP